MPTEYKLDEALARDIYGAAIETAERISRRRDSIGKSFIHHEEVAKRTVRFIEDSNRAALLWQSPSLAYDRARETALDPNVARYSTDCEDGRIGRAKKGAIAGIKTEHGQVKLQYVDSLGLWVPQGSNIQQSLEETRRHVLAFFRIHNRHCAAWEITTQTLSSPVWDYVTPQQKRHVLFLSQQDPSLGNMVFSELTNTRGYENYFQMIHGYRKRIGVTVLYDPHTTGIELVSPLVRFDEKGNVAALPMPSEMERLSTETFVKELSFLQERLNDPNIPEPGKYKNDYFEIEKFPQFSRELTDLTVAICRGQLEREDLSEWITPRAIVALREKLIDQFVNRNFADFPYESRQAIIHKTVHAGIRHYLLQGQTHTKEHQELHASGSDDGSNVGKYAFWYQTIRYNIPNVAGGETRLDVARKVMDKVGIDGNRPHVNFIVSRSSENARRLFELTQAKLIKEFITSGIVFPFSGVLDENGMYTATIPQTVKLL